MKKRILIVEDSEDDRVILRALLEHFGFKVLEAPNGFQGLKIAQLERPDLIIVDLAMPGMSGFDVAAEIRRSPGLEAVPLIALSAFADSFPAKQFQEVGFDEWRLKGVTGSELRSVMRRYFPDIVGEQKK